MTVNDANVVKADVRASNGVVHVIDKVLVPPQGRKGCYDNPSPACLRAKPGWLGFSCQYAAAWCQHPYWGHDARTCCPDTCGMCGHEQSPVPLSAVREILGAISEGVPMYNKGDIEGCFRRYLETAEAVLKSLGGSALSRMTSAIADAERASMAGDYDMGAWGLRFTFDDVLDSWEQQPSSSSSPSTVDLSTMQWEVTNDSVMGGVSISAVEKLGSTVVFSGFATTDSNGGFANTRTYFNPPTDWSTCDGITLRVKGDGLKYIVDLQQDASRWAPSYEAAITPNAEWTDIHLKWSDLKPTPYWADPFGRVAPLDARAIRSFGIKRTAFISGLKKDPSFSPGNFRVELDSLSCYQA